MKKNLTEIVFILDRSGSMGGLEQDTIGGFNSLIEKQKKEKGEAYISTVLFDHYSEVLHDRVDLKKIQPMTGEEYYVRGSTALLDAVGTAVSFKALHQAICSFRSDEDDFGDDWKAPITTDFLSRKEKI